MKIPTVLLGLALASATVHGHDIGHEHEHVEGGWNAKAGFVSDTDITAKLWNPRGKTQAVKRNRDAGVDLISTSVWAFEGVNDVSFEDTLGREYNCYASDFSYMYGAFLKAFIGQVDKYPPENGFGAPTENAWGGDICGVARVLEKEYGWS